MNKLHIIKQAGCFLLAVFSCLLLNAQVTTQAPYSTNIKVNYVRTFDAKAPDTGSANLITRPLKDVQQTTAYFDGLGRPLQTVVKQGSLVTGSSPVDLVSPVVYDEFGREKYKYLPFAANNAGSNTSINDGLFKLNPFQQQVQFYNTQLAGQTGETNVGSNNLNWAYSQTTFEASPLNRVQESFAPGSSWVGTYADPSENNRHSVKAKYYFNTTADDVKIWTVTDVANNWGTYAVTGTYGAGQLYKNITVNEHGKQVIEFKDKEGQVILKKVQINGAGDDGSGLGYPNWLCTYYVYDDLNRLRLVIQPRAVEHLFASGWSNNTLLNVLPNLCFRYEYDARNRMIRKKVPDGGEAWMVYDARDRLVLSQTARMRSLKQWLYTQYDELNRQLATGLIPDNANYNNLSYHQSRADTSTSYPNLNNYTEEELTRNFYDDYTWRSSYGNPLSDTYNTTYDTYLQPASNTTWPYPQANVQTGLTKGLLTGTRAKIVGSSNTYLYTVNIYDDKGRVIQTLATNMTSGEEHTTTQYTWSGQPLVVVQRTRKAGSNNPQTHVVVTTMAYDDLGRVLTVKKYLHSFFNNTNQHLYKQDQVIVQHEYDALGQLKTKKLLPTGGSGGAPLETLTYDYNIRGWMLGTNRDYAKDTASATRHFGFELSYDKNNLIINGITANYAANRRYNGDITGMLWKSAGDGRIRRYDFSYDVANRLINADFKQFTGSSFNLNAGIDFSATGLRYDANGNILAMNQRGWKPGGSVPIDSLVYNYLDYSNRLKNVIDHFNDTATKLGDFRASTKYVSDLGAPKNNSTIDYAYDADGSLVKDLNKDLGNSAENGITYNHLNLPSAILVKKAGGGNKGQIQYFYDAFGKKLRKIVSDSTVSPVRVTTTTYLDGTVYENDTLQFIGHEEGRLRYVKRRFTNGDSAYQFQYDYFLKDHLGNVRMVLTEQIDTAQYIATMEAVYRTKENQLFYNIPQTSYSKALVPGGYPTDNTTVPNDSLARTNGSGNKVGPALILKVMSGDKVDIAVKSFYRGSGAGSGTNDPVADILTSLATGLVGVAGESKGAFSTLSNSGTSPLLGALNSFRNTNNSTPSGKPKAYLNWILLDEQLQYVPGCSGADLIKDTGNIYALTSGGPVSITKNGFLYITSATKPRTGIACPDRNCRDVL